MKYSKSSGIQGTWLKSSEIATGTLVKIVSETTPNEGEYGIQDVCKVKIKGENEVKNARLNKVTVNGLIDAFGEDSKDWMDKVLTIQTEKVIVGGKRVTAMYFIPEGFELRENNDGFMEIKRIGTDTKAPVISEEEAESNYNDIGW